MKKFKRFFATVLSASMILAAVPMDGTVKVQAAGETGTLTSVVSAKADANVVELTFNGGIKGKLTFLEDGIFRYNVDPKGEFSEYAALRPGQPDAKIQQYPDSSINYRKPPATVTEAGGNFVISAGNTKVIFDKSTAKMTVKSGNKTVLEEMVSLQLGAKTVQTLTKHDQEQFFGGGTQNGRFIHTGTEINIANESSWTDGGVSSPSPFYYSTAGYGVLRNTFSDGKYNFGAEKADTVTAVHNENEFDAYYFVSGGANNSEIARELLSGYFHVTGNPVLLPAYAFYLGHLNAYNRDAWDSANAIGKGWTIKGNNPYNSAGTTTYEEGATGFEIKANQHAETLNGKGPTVFTQNVPTGVDYPAEFSAQAVLDEYLSFDMPFGFFLPNDGYGAGYGQNGYNVTGGVNPDGTSSADRLAAVAANVANLQEFAAYAENKGIATGLWTQSNLTPDSNAETKWHLLRDFAAEVEAGVTTLKTDVAWVGPGYSFQLNGVKQAYDIVTTARYNDGRANTRPNIISLDGWAGSQRYNSVWTGDQIGGNWEYIRFHIPTFIGQSLSGNPNIGSDMDGIWGGDPVIATRDYQWKSFAPQMLDMDGWGTYAKGPYVHGDPFTGVSRMYLKLKAMMMPYIYTNAYAAANIDTKNEDQGLPMVRAMFLEFPEQAEGYGNLAKYQYMWGENLLVAPVYEDNGADTLGNDVRNGIWLPKGATWIDYFTGEQYKGGQVLNDFDAPLWKMPLFVKNGAIIPMYAEHNVANPDAQYGVDKTKRIVEFWPAGETKFNTMEDDGSYIANNIQNDAGYGTIDNINYGTHVETLYTSKVEGTRATLTAQKSTGTYAGYNSKKDTTFIVHLSKAPQQQDLTAKNGNTVLKGREIASKADFDNGTPQAGEFLYCYDANPRIETFASAGETEIASMVQNVNVSGKLYVKFPNTDSQANAQTLIIENFENKGTFNEDKENTSLQTPQNFAQNVQATTPTSIALTWDPVVGATSYELMIDGSDTLYTIVGGNNAFTHTGLEIKSAHTYKLRAVNAGGYSAWTSEFTFTSADDPFRNTPIPASVNWTGGIYGSNSADKAFDQIFQEGDAGFHSDASALQSALTVDYGNAYIFDKIEYTHRPGGGNGVVRKMKVSTSLDGVHWVEQPEYTFPVSDDKKTMDLSDPSTGADAIGARYIKFQVLESVGGFFHANEIQPFTVDGATTFGNAKNPFRVGNISTLAMTEPTIDTFRQMYQKDSSAHGCQDSSAWRGEIQNVYGDINFNGISDVYDYAFTAFEVGGGTKKQGSVSGNILLVPSATSVKAGESITIDIVAMDLKNLNAYGTIINYNPDKLEYKSAEYIGTGLMYTQGMTGNWVSGSYSGGLGAYVNHNAINMGDMPLINGSKILSTVTMTAKENIDNLTDALSLDKVTLMGPDYSVAESVNEAPTIPNIPTVTTGTYPQSAFNITMTNDILTTDPMDGSSNVEKLIQSQSYDGLFDGTNARASAIEFKWDIPQNHVDGKLPEYVKTPVDFHLTFHTPSNVSKVSVVQPNPTGNGLMTKVEVKLIYEDYTESDVQTIDGSPDSYDFTWADDSKNVREIVITPSTATPSMLTIGEFEITYTTGAAATDIELDANNKTEVYEGYFVPVNASILPAECPNQYFTVASSNSSIASIITITGANGEPVYYVRGVAQGTAAITVASAADPAITKTYEVTVKAGVDKSELKAMIDKTAGVNPKFYEEKNYMNYKEAFDAAVAVYEDEAATRGQVENATANLDMAYDALVVVPVKEVQSLDTKDIVESAEALYSESNTPDKLFDGDLGTYWESPYSGGNVGLPKDVIVTLKEATMLEQVTFYSHTLQNGGVTDYTISVSMDGNTWIPVASGTINADEYKNGVNVRVDARFSEALAKYVKLTVRGAVGRIPSEDNQYGRIVEVNFYGVDKSLLSKGVKDAEQYVQDNYTEETYSAFQTALGNANLTLANKAASQADVDQALADLNAAIQALVEKSVDKTGLEAAIKAAEALKKEDFTADSWKVLEEALAAAKRTLADEKADQETVNAMTNALWDAIALLKKIETEPGGPDTGDNPPVPDDSGNGTDQPGTGPGTDDNPSTPGDQPGDSGNGTDQPGTGTGTDNNPSISNGQPGGSGNGTGQPGTRPKTGDTAEPVIFFILLISATVAMQIFRRKIKLTK